MARGTKVGLVLLKHNPGENQQATVTAAAPGADKYYIMRKFAATLSGDGTQPSAGRVDFEVLAGSDNLVDLTFGIPATAGFMNGINKDDMELEAPLNTAMIIRYSAAGGANVYESVSAVVEVWKVG